MVGSPVVEDNLAVLEEVRSLVVEEDSPAAGHTAALYELISLFHSYDCCQKYSRGGGYDMVLKVSEVVLAACTCSIKRKEYGSGRKQGRTMRLLPR